jgi:hypothetical protein
MKAYAVSILFVGVFVLLLTFGARLNISISAPGWALLIAASLTLPALAPVLVNGVLPRIKSIKIADVEIDLKEAQNPPPAFTQAVQTLGAALSDDPSLSEYAGRMTSYAGSIIDAIRAVQGQNQEVLPVDLSTRWVAPNLYFLALMAAQKTRILQIAFMGAPGNPGRFICFSSPVEILTALQERYPVLKKAAQAAKFDMDAFDANYAASDFFQQLGTIYAGTQTAGTERATTLTPESILWILGSSAHRDAIQWTGQPGEREYRELLAADSRFVAALGGNQLLFLIDRDRLALAIARAVAV